MARKTALSHSGSPLLTRSLRAVMFPLVSVLISTSATGFPAIGALSNMNGLIDETKSAGYSLADSALLSGGGASLCIGGNTAAGDSDLSSELHEAN